MKSSSCPKRAKAPSVSQLSCLINGRVGSTVFAQLFLLHEAWKGPFFEPGRHKLLMLSHVRKVKLESKVDDNEMDTTPFKKNDESD